jgi:hypothetical protein
MSKFYGELKVLLGFGSRLKAVLKVEDVEEGSRDGGKKK